MTDFQNILFTCYFKSLHQKRAPLVDARGVTIGVAKNVIFLTALHWPIRMWHSHLPSNVQRRSANQKIFRFCLNRIEQMMGLFCCVWCQMQIYRHLFLLDGQYLNKERTRPYIVARKVFDGVTLWATTDSIFCTKSEVSLT